MARWLRILGEDCVYAEPSWSDDEVAARALAEGRLVVTRDAQLAARLGRDGRGAVLVPAASAEEVLVVVYGAAGVRPDEDRAATRCAVCNGLLVDTDAAGAVRRAEAGGKPVPLPGVQARHERFWSCASCGQAYWRGTHWDTIEASRKRLFARIAASEPFNEPLRWQGSVEKKATATGQAIRVLLVEDRPLARKLLEAELANVADIEIVAEARNGREAVERVKGDAPDVVIMDIVMPEMDGIQALVEIRRFSQVPIIMFSGSRENAESLKHITMRRGADAFILKPSGSVSADLYKVRDELVATVRALAAPKLR